MGRIVDSRSELGVLLGVTKQTICSWLKRGMPKTEDGKFDVDLCTNWKKQNIKKWLRAPTVTKAMKQEIVALAANTHKTKSEIREMTGAKKEVVNTLYRITKKYGPELEKFKANKKDIFALEQMRYLDFISDQKLKKTAARDLRAMAKTAWEQERVERGESTDNVAVIVKHIKELKQAEDADQG